MPGGAHPDWRVRGASSDDTGAIVALVNAHARRYYGEDRIGADEVRTWFKDPGVPQEDTRSWWRADGTLAAYAQVYWPEFPAAWDVLHDVTLHPDHDGDHDLWDEVFDWCYRYQWNVRKHPEAPSTGIRCGARAHENDLAKIRQYESRGFARVRSESLMRVGLAEAAQADPEWPKGISVRRLDLGKDLEGYALAYGEAFRDHWGQADVPLDERIGRKKAEFAAWGDMYDRDLWFVAMDGGTIVGSVGCFPSYGNVPGRCYLYHVFVRREWRSRGIATALLRTAFQALRRRGGETVELHVDSENMTYGLELYRGLGMRPVWHQHLYERAFAASERPG